MRRWGLTPASAYGSVAARYPDRVALVDERGVLTFEQLDRRTNALARGLAQAGVAEGDGVAIMARNHRGFIEATAAVSKLGAGALYLNTAFAGPQIADVIAREDPVAVIYDEEFAGLVGDGARGRTRLLSWSDSDDAGGGGDEVPRLDELIEGNDDGPLQPPAEPGRTVILTSGTTGTPKGAARQAARLDRADCVAVLEDPAAGARDHDDRRPAVPLVGLRPLHDRAAARLDAGAAAALRRRGHAAGGRPARGHARSCSCR